jgi:hypothetical protein
MTRASPPDDPLVRNLLGDLGIPFFFAASNLRPPVEMLIIELFDLPNPSHELGKLLESGRRTS